MWGLILTATPFVNTWAHLNKKKKKKRWNREKSKRQKDFLLIHNSSGFWNGLEETQEKPPNSI